ncbi:MAG: hypothetical protein U0L08_06140 [Bacteroidales bacterium]|nr:hypothetical protein [Bacteroidales bacterium]
MKISNKNNRLITNLESWKTAFIEVDKKSKEDNGKSNWEEGRSACTLAKYFTTPNIEESDGIQKIKEYLEALGYSNLKFNSAEIEHRSPFDKYKGGTRMQDLVIWVESEKGRILACIEAKVDEEFNELLNKAYGTAKQKFEKDPNSNAQKRIEELCDKYLNVSAESIKSGDENDIRYQLLYYLAGSICEAKEYGNVVFMPIMVFKTDEYNKTKGDRNSEDYKRFIKALKFELCNKEKQIYKRTFENVDVYISYIEIDFKTKE